MSDRRCGFAGKKRQKSEKRKKKDMAGTKKSELNPKGSEIEKEPERMTVLIPVRGGEGGLV